ncbi:phosphomannomutase [Oceanibium sediminis]|uniref:phosphomannomutase n=1 Tax=Oceanibium sediminis TaxID=2026339 RepID=UPI000DD485A1|nr:phosphomannomutase [Oceanibium sediminis]
MSPRAPFKAYDVRGVVGKDLTEPVMERIGAAFAAIVAKGGPVVVGRDARASSPAFAAALARGLQAGGSDVLDIGLCGTEEVYFATDHLGAAGGIMVTASHNPPGDNGLKMVRSGARPLDRDSGLAEIEEMVLGPDPAPRAARPGELEPRDIRGAYVEKLLGFTHPEKLAPLHILVNAGNGAAGPTFDALAEGLQAAGAPLRFTRYLFTPDPTFPNGVPNPILPENHAQTADALRAAGADFGVAWDGDFDRCFFFDHTGAFIDGAYIVGLLAAAVLRETPGETVVYDPRVVLNTLDIIGAAGGRGVQAKTGHSFMKSVMRAESAAYGGEMSAHHYFRDFMFCDSGMIPVLKVAELLSAQQVPLAELVAARARAFPVSGERNFSPADPDAAIARVEARFAPEAEARDDSDGMSLRFATWRFNLRRSNTENLVRLNVESIADAPLVKAKVAEIATLLA